MKIELIVIEIESEFVDFPYSIDIYRKIELTIHKNWQKSTKVQKYT